MTAAGATTEVPAGFDAARAVADAVLYEGYLLYPYRRSSGKNRMRWQFGVLAPPGWTAEQPAAGAPGVSGSADGSFQQADCLLEAPGSATVFLRLRFLQVIRRRVEQRDASGRFVPVDELDVDGTRELSFDEGRPCEVDLTVALSDLIDPEHGPLSIPVLVPGGVDAEPLGRRPGEARVVRRRWPVTAAVHLSATRAEAPFRLHRLRVVVENTVADLAAGRPRAEALHRSLVAAHSLLGVRGGRFLSLLDPPAWAATAARACENLRVFPVLAGGARDVMLCSPIILYDDPRTAPESPGDLFDATEIDEILSLRTAALTEEEKREARATDRRAAEILDRVDGIPRAMLDRLHGAVRSLRPVEPPPAPPPADAGARGDAGARADAQPQPAAAGHPDPDPHPVWWEPEADRSVHPDRDSVLVAGVTVARGSRVRLRPRPRGSDAHDMFLAGRVAWVEAIFLDVDGTRHAAVTLDGDGAGDLHRAAGRYFYFAPDELDPLDVPTDADRTSAP
ncbi:hypothetical protein [Frankia tisae]|uniref:hypothetical protein n=1 Tax=Frankia tisae TaxID=2950104 RepID=UPI0021C06C01|nr:hypothetical protein [Frankia tisae]